MKKAILSACAILWMAGCASSPDSAELAVDGLSEELRTSKAKSAELAVENSRLKAENARLANRLLAMQRDQEKEETLTETKPELRIEPAAAPTPATAETPLVVPPKRDEVVVAEAAAPELRGSDVPFEEAPRLVQPTFASAQEVYENEAPAEIATSSVLFGVHLASYRQMSEAQEGWRKLQRENPDELGLLEPRVEEVDLPDRGAFLRLIGGGFSSRTKADTLCAELKSKGLFCAVSGFAGDRLSLGDAG